MCLIIPSFLVAEEKSLLIKGLLKSYNNNKLPKFTSYDYLDFQHLHSLAYL